MQLTVEKHYFNMLMKPCLSIRAEGLSEHKSACACSIMTFATVVSLWDSRSANFAWLFPTPDSCDISRPVCEFPQKPKVIFKCILAHLSTYHWTSVLYNLWPPRVHWSHWALMEPEMKPQCRDLRQALTSSDGNGFSAVFAEPWLHICGEKTPPQNSKLNQWWYLPPDSRFSQLVWVT